MGSTIVFVGFGTYLTGLLVGTYEAGSTFVDWAVSCPRSVYATVAIQPYRN